MEEQAPEEVKEEPPPAKQFVDGGQAIDRIKALGETARAAWFVLLGYLGFVGITLLSVQDLDFFSAAARTQLPLVGIAIPTMTFFLTAPVLGAALHVYLHLYLLKLWDALAEAPPSVDDAALGDRVFPWLVVDWALRRRPDAATRARPLDRLGNWVMAGLVWLAAPIVLGWFWWRSATAHDPWLTLVIAAAFAVSLYASYRGWRQARACLSHAGRAPPAAARWRLRLWRWAVLPLAVTVLVVTSWLRTEGGLAYYADRAVETFGPWVGLTFVDSRNEEGNRVSEAEVRLAWVRERFPTLASVSLLDDAGRIRWTPLAGIDLIGAEIAARPADWLGRDTAERRFRVDWCRDRGLPADACTPPPHAPYQSEARETWCDERNIDDCAAAFQALDDAFDREWAEQRGEYLANIIRPDLRGRDLRHAAISRAFLAGIDLRDARLEGANLDGARLEGADLSRARLEGAKLASTDLRAVRNLRLARLEDADLGGARLEGADLRDAGLEGADFRFARLEGADLSRARLEGAKLASTILREVRNLRLAWLEGADLNRVRLEGANLGEARLERADLGWAQLERAYLGNAWLVGAYLRGARLKEALIPEARLKGADLREAGLERAYLAGAWLEGADLRQTRLTEAYLGGARLKGADLRGARLEGADLGGQLVEARNLNFAGQRPRRAGSTIGPSPAHSAIFSAGKNLTQTQLTHVIGDDETILPRDAETGRQLHVWACWEEAAAEVFVELRTWYRERPTAAELWEEIRNNAWVCADGMEPLPVLGKR